MTQHPELTLTNRRAFQTQRQDTWWLQPLAVFLGLGAFIVYATFRVFEGGPFHHTAPTCRLSIHRCFSAPMHIRKHTVGSVCSQSGWQAVSLHRRSSFCGHRSDFASHAITYRGAYYKAFWADPPSCTVSEPRNNYRGEHSFPLIIQNIHRYFLYVAIIVVGILAYDVWKALWFDDGNGGTTFGIGVGTIILAGNVVLLGGYTFGCHSLRHLVGGVVDLLSKAPIRRGAYNCVSCLNRRHMLWAWLSLCWVGFSDVYVRFIAPAVGTDWITF